MSDAVRDPPAMVARAERGAAHAASRFSWDAVTKVLVEKLLP